jgi:membrane protein
VSCTTGAIEVGPQVTQPQSESAIGHAVNFAVSFATISILFGMLFKWFPDTDVAWRDVWFWAVTAALLFNLGKGLIAWYIGTQALESTYGAAASIVVLLMSTPRLRACSSAPSSRMRVRPCGGSRRFVSADEAGS